MRRPGSPGSVSIIIRALLMKNDEVSAMKLNYSLAPIFALDWNDGEEREKPRGESIVRQKKKKNLQSTLQKPDATCPHRQCIRSYVPHSDAGWAGS